MHWRIRARSVKPNILSSLSSAFYHGGKGRTRRICIGGDGYFFGSFGLDCFRYLHWHHESNTARQLGLSSVGCMCVYHFFSACRLSYSLGAKSHNKWRPGKTGSPPAVALLLFSSRMAHMQRPVLPWAHCTRVRVRLPRSATTGASRNSPFAQASVCPGFLDLPLLPGMAAEIAARLRTQYSTATGRQALGYLLSFLGRRSACAMAGRSVGVLHAPAPLPLLGRWPCCSAGPGGPGGRLSTCRALGWACILLSQAQPAQPGYGGQNDKTNSSRLAAPV